MKKIDSYANNNTCKHFKTEKRTLNDIWFVKIRMRSSVADVSALVITAQSQSNSDQTTTFPNATTDNGVALVKWSVEFQIITQKLKTLEKVYAEWATHNDTYSHLQGQHIIPAKHNCYDGPLKSIKNPPNRLSKGSEKLSSIEKDRQRITNNFRDKVSKDKTFSEGECIDQVYKFPEDWLNTTPRPSVTLISKPTELKNFKN